MRFKSSNIQQRFNSHRAVCMKCFAFCISDVNANPVLCDEGKKLQDSYQKEYALEGEQLSPAASAEN